MTHFTRLAPIVLVAGLLAACAPGTGTDPDTLDEPASGDSPCVVGTWNLDVPDYATRSEAFLLGLGIPITEFAMTGAGTIQFTADGLVATDISLTSTGTLVAGDVRVPINVPSHYTASGDWAAGDDPDSINLDNWSSVPDPDVPVDPDAPPIPAIDFTGIPSVGAACTADTLTLQAPDAPLASVWHR